MLNAAITVLSERDILAKLQKMREENSPLRSKDKRKWHLIVYIVRYGSRTELHYQGIHLAQNQKAQTNAQGITWTGGQAPRGARSREGVVGVTSEAAWRYLNLKYSVYAIPSWKRSNKGSIRLQTIAEIEQPNEARNCRAEDWAEPFRKISSGQIAKRIPMQAIPYQNLSA